VVEYGLGLNPRVANQLPLPGANRVISFQKGAEAAADPGVTYKLQVSENLATWTTLTPTVNNTTQITGQLPTTSSTGKVFGRLVVEYTR